MLGEVIRNGKMEPKLQALAYEKLQGSHSYKDRSNVNTWGFGSREERAFLDTVDKKVNLHQNKAFRENIRKH